MTDKPRQQRFTGFEEETGASEAPPAAGSPVGEVAAGTDVQRLDGQQVYVLDAHSLIYQVFHARGEMSGPRGQPVGAIDGFLRDILTILDQRQPDYLLCAFDPPGKTFRHQIYDQYKANRASMPDDLRPQIRNIQRFLEALAIPVLTEPGYEADDVLATVARQVEQLGGECFLVTSDKDCCQLITDHVKIFNIRKRAIVDAAAVSEQLGVRPDQVVDLQALWGDATDNIPGITGVGQKTASQLLAQYETLEGIFEHIDEISGAKRRERIRAGHDAALLSRRLVCLSSDVPVNIQWDAARVGGTDTEAVLALCNEFGFRRLRERWAGASVVASWPALTTAYRTINSLAQLQQLVRDLSQQARIAVDTETTSTHARWADIVGYCFSWKPGDGVYVPVRAPEGEPQLDPAVTLATLRTVFEDERIEKVGQNLKYDFIVLRGAGVKLHNVAFDTMVADYLLEPGVRSHSLDDLAKRYLDHETIKISELIGSGKKQKRMDQVPVASVTDYAAEDADICFRLSEILAPRLRDQGLDDLFYALEMPLIEVLSEMEFNGIRIDVPLLQRLGERFGRQLAELESEIYVLAGRTFNIDSPKQLAGILFEELGLPVIKRTKTGPSTDAGVLSELAVEHPLPARIIDYRQLAKLKNTYVDALPALVHPVTGRVHTSFKQDVAATGRLSSTDPNLQNIPVRTADGREIRAAFIPGQPGWQLLCADYSQIELRVLAHFSRDEALVAAFADDCDIHTQVASEVYAVPLSQVTTDMRRTAKAINFGVIYGQSPFGLAKTLSIGTNEAADFINAYFERYPGVDRFINKLLAECQKSGYVSTALGRRRGITGTRDPSLRDGSRQRNLPERIAINTVIQGSAADLIKQAMIRVHQRMQRERMQTRMLLQIHDELVFETPADEINTLAALVTEEMSAVGNMSVPLKVDVKVGANWAQCEPIHGGPIHGDIEP